MSELRELYQQLIIDHGRKPRNFGELPDCTHSKEGYNPLCGDQITVQLVMKGDTVCDAKFTGEGCAISVASCSLMTEALVGKSKQEAQALFDAFHRMIMTPAEVTSGDQQLLGKLIVLEGVNDFPARVKCATLAWHTLHALLDQQQGKVSTE